MEPLTLAPKFAEKKMDILKIKGELIDLLKQLPKGVVTTNISDELMLDCDELASDIDEVLRQINNIS